MFIQIAKEWELLWLGIERMDQLRIPGAGVRLQHTRPGGHREATDRTPQKAAMQVFAKGEPLLHARKGARGLCGQPAQLGRPITGMQACARSYMDRSFI